MVKEERIQRVIDSLDTIKPCSGCGMRYRVGDLECPQCGTDLEDNLREWAEGLLGEMGDRDDV
jgi:hypothetical protein